MLPDGMLIGCRQGNLFEVLRTLDGPLTACNVVNKGCKASLCNITLHLKNFTHKSGLDCQVPAEQPPEKEDYSFSGGSIRSSAGRAAPRERRFFIFGGQYQVKCRQSSPPRRKVFHFRGAVSEQVHLNNPRKGRFSSFGGFC